MNVTMINKENEADFINAIPEEYRAADILLGAVDDDGTACGVLAADIETNRVVIRFIFVVPERRRRKAGRAMLSVLRQICSLSGIDFAEAAFSETEDEDGAILALLKSNGYKEKGEPGKLYSVLLKDLDAVLGESVKKFGNNDEVRPLSELELYEFECLRGDKGAFIAEIHDRAYYDGEASYVKHNKAGRDSFILVSRHGADYVVDYLHSDEKSSAFDMMELITASYKILNMMCMPNTVLYVNALNETTEKLVIKISSGKAKKLGNARTLYCAY